jgi:hypothetical protein
MTRIVIIALALAMILGAWYRGACDGYAVGAQDAYAGAFAAGKRAAMADVRARCKPWYPSKKVEAARGATP